MVRGTLEVSAAPASTLEEAQQRCDAYLASVDPQVLAREDALPRALRATNASVSSKLRQVYVVIDQLTAAARPFAACSKGCSACCHMNVMISGAEAGTISRATGVRPADISHSKVHGLEAFSGVPCPFLKERVCSIYEHRPFACRKHLSFHTSDYWCRPEHSHEEEMPLVRYSGAEEAYFAVTGGGERGVLADIRDFFPMG